MAESDHLDELDRQIIAALAQDGRLSDNAIARRLGVSHVTVRQRVRRMRTRGMLNGVPVLEPAAVGHPHEVEMQLKVDSNEAGDVAQKLRSHPAVRRVVFTQTREVVLSAAFPTDEAREAFLRSVALLPGVNVLQMLPAASVVKR